MSVIDSVIDDHRICVLISGGPGAGKSAQLHELASRLRDVGQHVSYDVGSAVPGWIVVDDAHLLDGRRLGALVEAVVGGRLRVLAAAEPRDHFTELGALAAVAARDGGLVVHEPLTTADVLARADGTGLTTAGAALIRRRSLGVRVVVDETLALLDDAASDQRVAAVVEDAAAQWQHRLLRRLDPVTQSVLVLAALRQPVDPASAAAVLGVEDEVIVGALDAARGSGLLSASDVFPGVAVGALRTVVGDARFTGLHRASLSFRLQHNVLSVDEAMAAVGLGITDPALVEVLIDAVDDGPAAGRLLALLQRVTPEVGDTLRIARTALAANHLDVASALTDDLLTRCATGELDAEFDSAALVSVAAEVAWSRGHLAHAATLFSWLKRATGSSGGAGALIADVGTGAGIVADDASGLAPTGAQLATDLFRAGLAASLSADYLGAAQQLSQSVTLGIRSASHHVAPDVWVATMLALHVGDDAGARHLAASDGTGLLSRLVGVVGGGSVSGDAAAGTPRDRLLLAAADLGAARRSGDAELLRRRWAEYSDVLLTPCSDLFALLLLGEIAAAATELGHCAAVAAHVAAADRLLAAYGDPPAWTSAWRSYFAPAGDPAAQAPADASLSVDGPLTDREAEVARELLAGFTYREIGERLFISAKTVEHHVSRIRRRLDAGSRSDLLSALRAAGYE